MFGAGKWVDRAFIQNVAFVHVISIADFWQAFSGGDIAKTDAALLREIHFKSYHPGPIGGILP